MPHKQLFSIIQPNIDAVAGISSKLPLKESGNQIKEAAKSYGTAKVISPWTDAMDCISNEIKLRHYSPKTLKSYLLWAEKMKIFTKNKPPKDLTPNDVKDFLTFLAVEKKVSASSQNQAFNALLFFFRHVLKKEFGKIDGVVRARRKPSIPVVLSRNEIDRIISHLKYPYDLVVKLLYGCGLRLGECMSLRINNFNFDYNILTIHDGKGKKDRTVPLPQSIRSELDAQVERVIAQHQYDIDKEYDGVFMPGILEKKYQNAGKELIRQWFFPARELTYVSETNESRRYHLHETHVQKAIKKAVGKSKLLKKASPHTFRHSFASHLLQANYDIRTIQKLLGHSDVRTTMIYTRTIKSRTLKESKSPLDL
jgi:integron integrase